MAQRQSGSHDLAQDLLNCGNAFRPVPALLLLPVCSSLSLSTQSRLLLQAWQLMFDSVDTANDCIRIATGVLSTIKINPKKMLAGLSPDMLATDLAEYLVRKGALRAGVSFQLHSSPGVSPEGPLLPASSVLLMCFGFLFVLSHRYWAGVPCSCALRDVQRLLAPLYVGMCMYSATPA